MPIGALNGATAAARGLIASVCLGDSGGLEEHRIGVTAMPTDTELLKFVQPSGASSYRATVETSAQLRAFNLAPQRIFLPSKSLWDFNSPMDRRSQDA
jgi:hypothetical protein